MRGGGGGGGGGGGEGGDIGGESPPAYTCLRELRLASARTFTCAVSRHSFSHLSNSIPLQQCLTLSFFRNSHKLCFSSILHLYELWAWDVQRSIFKYIRKWMNDSKLIKQMSPFLYDKHSQCDITDTFARPTHLLFRHSKLVLTFIFTHFRHSFILTRPMQFIHSKQKPSWIFDNFFLHQTKTNF